MAADLVTIGITAYEAADTIERAVRSALAQTWPQTEVVVVDDASGDATTQVVSAVAAGCARVRLFVQPQNQGVAAARNRILAEARGSFVAFFDDDDVSHPERIARQVRRILDYERDHAAGAPVICHTARLVRYPDGRERLEGTMGERLEGPAPAGLAVAERTLLGIPAKDADGACPTCSQTARIETYQAVGGFDPLLRRSEDTEFVVRLARAGGHFVGLADPLVEQTMTATTDKRLEAEHAAMVYIFEKHRNLLEARGEYAFAQAWLEAKHQWLRGRHLRFGLALGRLLMHAPRPTMRRLAHAAPRIGLNRAYRRFQSTLGDRP